MYIVRPLTFEYDLTGSPDGGDSDDTTDEKEEDDGDPGSNL